MLSNASLKDFLQQTKIFLVRVTNSSGHEWWLQTGKG